MGLGGLGSALNLGDLGDLGSSSDRASTGGSGAGGDGEDPAMTSRSREATLAKVMRAVPFFCTGEGVGGEPAGTFSGEGKEQYGTAAAVADGFNKRISPTAAKTAGMFAQKWRDRTADQNGWNKRGHGGQTAGALATFEKEFKHEAFEAKAGLGVVARGAFSQTKLVWQWLDRSEHVDWDKLDRSKHVDWDKYTLGADTFVEKPTETSKSRKSRNAVYRDAEYKESFMDTFLALNNIVRIAHSIHSHSHSHSHSHRWSIPEPRSRDTEPCSETCFRNERVLEIPDIAKARNVGSSSLHTLLRRVR